MSCPTSHIATSGLSFTGLISGITAGYEFQTMLDMEQECSFCIQISHEIGILCETQLSAEDRSFYLNCVIMIVHLFQLSSCIDLLEVDDKREAGIKTLSEGLQLLNDSIAGEFIAGIVTENYGSLGLPPEFQP